LSFIPLIDRRRFAKATGVAIASIGTGITPAYAGSVKPEKKVRLPSLISDGEPVEYFEVPKKWDNHRTRVKEILRAHRSDLTKGEGVTGVQLTSASTKIGGHPGLKIEVQVDPGFSGHDILPDQVENVEIGTKNKTSWKERCM
jgi:hypothetical protein